MEALGPPNSEGIITVTLHSARLGEPFSVWISLLLGFDLALCLSCGVNISSDWFILSGQLRFRLFLDCCDYSMFTNKLMMEV